jgi:uncharacterized membrane protein (UPF0127 family)
VAAALALVVLGGGLALAVWPEPGGPAPVTGFGQVGFRVEKAGRRGPPRCALLADNERQRARGLMGRRDLAGHDGMVFRFPADTATPFYMRNTPMPLSIAWLGADGGFVSSADMTPCPNRDGCPRYHPEGPYRYALEVRRGDLARLGVGPGSRLVLGPAGCGR